MCPAGDDHLSNDAQAKPEPFSVRYWEARYAQGGNSGDGSYNELAAFKARVINHFIARNKIETVLEFGCGDGNQLSLFNIKQYVGYDVSRTVLARCRLKFVADTSKQFFLMKHYDGRTAELVLSLDVIYHLVEDDVYHDYMTTLFNAGQKFVVIYAPDNDNFTAPHCRARKFTPWVQAHCPDWELAEHIVNEMPTQSWSDFYIYRKSQA